MDLEKILPKNGPPLNEVTKYIKKYKNDLIVIKYGGNVYQLIENVFNNFITDLSVLNKLGLYQLLLFMVADLELKEVTKYIKKYKKI